MFREMRRGRQTLSMEECEEILSRATSGVLAVSGDDDYPYAVPISFAYAGGKVYFHCAREGHKLDAIARNEKVSFCVIDQDEIVPERFTTHFRSVVLFGRARVLDDAGEIRRALTLVGEKYSPNRPEALKEEVEHTLSRVTVVELAVEHMTGKEAIELTRMRNGASNA